MTTDRSASPPAAPTDAEPEVAGRRQAALHATGSAIPPEELERLTADIVAALKTVYDPEIPADIYELGLIYRVDIDDDRNIDIDMTLTAPGCPVAGEMPGWVENAVSLVPGRRQRQRQHGVRPAVDAGAHVRRGAGGARLVLRPAGSRHRLRHWVLVHSISVAFVWTS